MYRIKTGGRIPAHKHQGQELTVVLHGGFSDHKGIYLPGDFVFNEAGDGHAPVVAEDEACICLIALSAPVQFTGIVRRLLNPFLKISPK